MKEYRITVVSTVTQEFGVTANNVNEAETLFKAGEAVELSRNTVEDSMIVEEEGEAEANEKA